jgi:hypothetical protein
MDTNVIPRLFPASGRTGFAFGEAADVTSVGDFNHATLDDVAGSLVGLIQQNDSPSTVSFPARDMMVLA